MDQKQARVEKKHYEPEAQRKAAFEALRQIKVFHPGVCDLESLKAELISFNYLNGFYDIKAGEVMSGPFVNAPFFNPGIEYFDDIPKSEIVLFKSSQKAIICSPRVYKNQVVLFYHE